MSMLSNLSLDDRTFQDIVDEAKKRIPHYTPQWSDHNVSDPGVTLIELFAWMTETILYRLNRVPLRHAVRMMEILGVTLAPPEPAETEVTFWFTSDRTEVIPAGTEVATTQTETQRSIIFTTDKDLKVTPPKLAAAVSLVAAPQEGSNAKAVVTHNITQLQQGLSTSVPIFSAMPVTNDALYLGFDTDLSHHILQLDLDVNEARGAGSNPEHPPYVWEAFRNEDDRWGATSCYVDQDTTGTLNKNGTIRIVLPQMTRASLNERIANNAAYFWVRLKLRELTLQEEEAGYQPYQESPELFKLAVSTRGGSVPVTHSQVIHSEFIGRSDGSAGQRFFLQHLPILERDEDEYLEVITPNEQSNIAQVEQWHEVADFADSWNAENERGAKHYVIDSLTGELRFGPAVRQPNGKQKLYGAVPPRNATLRFVKYRTGGGVIGNVQAHKIDTLKSAIPYVEKVRNLVGAVNGKEAETVEDAIVRAPQLLRSQQRAVTESDFEFLAREAMPGEVGRVKCLQPRPLDEGRVQDNRIFVMAIPDIRNPRRRLLNDELNLNQIIIDRITDYLNERRLLTSHLEVLPPTYRGVAIHATLHISHRASEAMVRAEALDRLYTFINPVIGGYDGKGWEFGRPITRSDVFYCLHGIDEVRSVEFQMFDSIVGGPARGPDQSHLDVAQPYGIVASGLHVIETTYV